MLGKPDCEYTGKLPPRDGKPASLRSGSPAPASAGRFPLRPTAGTLPTTSGSPSSNSKPALDGLPRAAPSDGNSTLPRGAGAALRTSGSPAGSDGKPTSPKRGAGARSVVDVDGEPVPKAGLVPHALTEGKPMPVAARSPTVGKSTSMPVTRRAGPARSRRALARLAKADPNRDRSPKQPRAALDVRRLREDR